MAEDQIITEIASAITTNTNLADGIYAAVAVAVIGIIVKLVRDNLLNRIFSPKPVLKNNGHGFEAQPITEDNIEKKNTPLEERLALRTKATLEPILKDITAGLERNHTNIVKLEEKIDAQYQAQSKINETFTNVQNKLFDKIDTLAEKVNEHVGYGKAVTNGFLRLRKSNLANGKNNTKRRKRNTKR